MGLKEKNKAYPDTSEVGELGVGVDVHLNNTVGDSSLDLLLGGTGATVENEVPR